MDITGYSPRFPRRRCAGCTAVEIHGISVAVKLSKLPLVSYRGVALEYSSPSEASARSKGRFASLIEAISLIKADVQRYSMDDTAKFASFRFRCWFIVALIVAHKLMLLS